MKSALAQLLMLLGLVVGVFGFLAIVWSAVADGAVVEGDRVPVSLLERTLDRNRELTDLVGALRERVEELELTVDRYDDPLEPSDLTAFASMLGCYEDSLIIRTVGEVLPDNGIPPGLDWGQTDGGYACVPADDLYVR